LKTFNDKNTISKVKYVNIVGINKPLTVIIEDADITSEIHNSSTLLFMITINNSLNNYLLLTDDKKYWYSDRNNSRWINISPPDEETLKIINEAINKLINQ